jgi:hypothetical protein
MLCLVLNVCSPAVEKYEHGYRSAICPDGLSLPGPNLLIELLIVTCCLHAVCRWKRFRFIIIAVFGSDYPSPGGCSLFYVRMEGRVYPAFSRIIPGFFSVRGSDYTIATAQTVGL